MPPRQEVGVDNEINWIIFGYNPIPNGEDGSHDAFSIKKELIIYKDDDLRSIKLVEPWYIEKDFSQPVKEQLVSPIIIESLKFSKYVEL